jgi:diaminopimelate decarboxylase
MPTRPASDAPTLHDPFGGAGTDALRLGCVGVVPLPARIEAWQREVLRRPELLRSWVERHGSPSNLHHPAPFVRNVRALQQVASDRDVDLEVLFARKADKALIYVDTARELGIGVDTASEVELTEAIAHGCDPRTLVCTAAVKPAPLLRTCLAEGVTIVLDNDDELDLVERLAAATGLTAIVSLRFGGFRHDGRVLPTRFGFDLDDAGALLTRLRAAADAGRVRVEGVHCHLDGYEVGHRVAAVTQLLPVVDALRAERHPVRHLDVGGGLPMRYVDDAGAWARFRAEHRRALLGERDPITWNNDGYGLHAHDGVVHGALGLYPMHQDRDGPAWLAALLDTPVTDGSGGIAAALRDRALTLRIEPGRSLLDGCGMTVARVEHRKRHRDGSWSVGLAMNRTQCSTAKPDHAIDPLLIAVHDDEPRTGPVEGWLTGAYCTEAELLTRRRLRFPNGVARGDLVVFPNTAGYLMHFVESRSHRFPLARNLVVDEAREAVELDAVDRVHG